MSSVKMRLTPVQGSSRVEIDTGISEVGRLLLWVPEGVSTDTGCSAVYPVGTWTGSVAELQQAVGTEGSVGTGNCPRLDEDTFECCGIRFPADSAVEWRTRVLIEADAVSFTIRLANVGDRPMRKAGAAICLRFLNAGWWSDETTFVRSAGRLVPLSELGRDAGEPNAFQAYLLRGEAFGHAFYQRFWGFNANSLDEPVMISQHTQGQVCVGIQSERAYFLHSNEGNPCTDMMLAFGDIEPGAASQASGTVWVRQGLAADVVGERRCRS